MIDNFQPQPDGIPVIHKDPSAILDYGEDWLALGWLATGETIIDYAVTVQAGLTKEADISTPNGAATVITVWLSGGEIGVAYLVSIAITTSSTPPRHDTRSFRVHVLPR